MTSLEHILHATPNVDSLFSPNGVLPTHVTFGVPRAHRRANELQEYAVVQRELTTRELSEAFVLIDESVPLPFSFSSNSTRPVRSNERVVKTVEYVRRVVAEIQHAGSRSVYGIGGGVTLNVASAAAAATHKRLVLVPTTVLAMSDACTGGKVRLNAVSEGRVRKHAVRSDYDPDSVVLDWRFLQTLRKTDYGWGWSEAVKHGVFQSQALLEFLCQHHDRLLSDNHSTRRAIIWTLYLKRLCLAVDPDESDGGRAILGACHDLAHRLEEDSGLQISHGQAVFASILNFVRQTRSPWCGAVEHLLTAFGIRDRAEEIIVVAGDRVAA